METINTGLPRWKCHKEVQAFKITGINVPPNQNGYVKLSGDGIEVDVTPEYMKKHRPQVGGYYVLYEDGYHSFSPGAAFESGYIGTHVIFYGPHACDKCGVLICKMGREYGFGVYTYPEGPAYPNSDWNPHICQQRDIERVNGLRSIGFGMVASEAPKETAWQGDTYTGPETATPSVRMYSDNEVRRLLRKTQERGINLDEGSPVDGLTIAELDEMLI